MARVQRLSRDDIGGSAVYVFEGGIAQDHRTTRSALTSKIRMGCLFGNRVLVHAGNLFEEAAMFEAVRRDSPLLAQGNIVPLLTGDARSLAEYGSSWGQRFARQDPEVPVFYQGLPVTRKHLRDIDDRVDYFKDAQHRILTVQPGDRDRFLAHFLANVEQILAAEPALDPSIKEAVRRRAGARSSPLGRIRNEVARPHWNTPGVGKIVRRVVRRVNVAYFGSSAREFGTWFSLNENAFRDLRAAPARRPTVVTPFVEMSVTKALDIPAERIMEIRAEHFADIANSPQAVRFRAWLERTLTKAGRAILEDADQAALERLRQHEVDEALRDTFAEAIAKAGRRRRRLEDGWGQWGIDAGLVGIGVATDYFTGGLGDLAGAGAGAAGGIAASQAVKALIQPRVAPVVMLQARIRRAADRRD
ncbi:hypothetical protein [Actinoplanes sp. NPDC048796]|uniref:hypothetical protein n=1 Tax=Actinoplanes sp. NPDC048796 TaxID=3155640 RepID=UPI0033E3C71A